MHDAMLHACIVCGARSGTPCLTRGKATNWPHDSRACTACGPYQRFAVLFAQKHTAPADGCWLWTGAKDSDGYGHIVVARRLEKASRMAWRLSNGEIPPGLLVLHRCDVRACVRIEHLFLGTHRENMADCKTKGRIAAGERHPCAKLTSENVREIRAIVDQGTTLQCVAARFGVAKSTVSRIAAGRSWKSCQ